MAWTKNKEAATSGKANVLKRLGPGLITGASDDDPSGIGTYSQAGAQLGFGVSWTMLLRRLPGVAGGQRSNLTLKEWIVVLKAADTAARWHVHQRRKGAAQEPYINHLLEVASLVAEATHGQDPELVIAALLHDAIEDQGVPSELI